MRKFYILPLMLVVLAGLVLACGTGNPFDFGQKETQSSSENAKVPPAENGNFSGIYEVEGDGYTADLTIKKTGDCYYVKWKMGDGTLYYGKGIEVAGVLGVVYDMGDGMTSGVVAYKKVGTGISGLWTTAGGEELYYEKSTQTSKLRADRQDIAGEYSIKGSNATGGGYDGSLVIAKSGEGWAIQWSSGGEIYGSGICVDDVLVAGYGNDEGIGVAVYEIGTSKLEGLWLYISYGELSSERPVSLGSEVAKR